MTSKVARHLERRLQSIETSITELKDRIGANKEIIKIAEENLFAYKVERQALKRAFDSWNIDQEE